MARVADPMNVLAIADSKGLIAPKVCTAGSVDFPKGEVILFVKTLLRETYVETLKSRSKLADALIVNVFLLI